MGEGQCGEGDGKEAGIAKTEKLIPERSGCSLARGVSLRGTRRLVLQVLAKLELGSAAATGRQALRGSGEGKATAMLLITRRPKARKAQISLPTVALL